MARFMHGLKSEVRDRVDMVEYNGLQGLLHHAIRAEQQVKHCAGHDNSSNSMRHNFQRECGGNSGFNMILSRLPRNYLHPRLNRLVFLTLVLVILCALSVVAGGIRSLSVLIREGSPSRKKDTCLRAMEKKILTCLVRNLKMVKK